MTDDTDQTPASAPRDIDSELQRLFSSRQDFYAPPYSRRVLMLAILGTQTLTAPIVSFGWLVAPIPWSFVLMIWLYCLAWLFIKDGAKRLLLSHMEASTPRHRRFLRLAGRSLSAHHHL